MIKWILVGVGLILVAVIAFVGLRHHEGATRMQELQALEYYSEIEEHFVEPCIREVLARSGITKGNAPEEFKEKWLNDPGAQQGIKGLDAMVSGLSL